MTCRLCAWLCDRICPPDSSASGFWRASFDWEQAYASDWEPPEQGATFRKRRQEAKELLDEDPAAAFAIHRELAEDGSPFSMLKTGWNYESGRGTAVDLAAAEEFYRRALCAGSWKATLSYAGMLFKRGADSAWPSTLGDGADKGFIPAFFWLAWYRYKRAPGRKTAREVRPLLETAAGAGHPGARLMLARWKASGKFGLREIPNGIRLMRPIVRSAIEAESSNASTAAQGSQPAGEPNKAGASTAADLALEVSGTHA
jgi:hypothetical protein